VTVEVAHILEIIKACMDREEHEPIPWEKL
jgi:hypothetical protein